MAKRKATTKQPPPADVHVFKVALRGVRGLWRRIAARGDQTLDDLHWACYDAFDRYDEHLYSFYFPPPGSRGRAALRNAVEYTHPFNAQEGDLFSDLPLNNAVETPLASLNLVPGQRFLYLFDFGDAWWHEWTVEQTDAPRERGKYPRILERRGDSPPQYPDFEEDEEA